MAHYLIPGAFTQSSTSKTGRLTLEYFAVVQQVLRHNKDSHIPRGSATYGRGIISLPFHLPFESNPAIDQLTKLQVTPTRVHVQLSGKVGFINTLLELPGCCCCCLIDRIL